MSDFFFIVSIILKLSVLIYLLLVAILHKLLISQQRWLAANLHFIIFYCSMSFCVFVYEVILLAKCCVVCVCLCKCDELDHRGIFNI